MDFMILTALVIMVTNQMTIMIFPLLAFLLLQHLQHHLPFLSIHFFYQSSPFLHCHQNTHFQFLNHYCCFILPYDSKIVHHFHLSFLMIILFHSLNIMYLDFTCLYCFHFFEIQSFAHTFTKPFYRQYH